MRLSGMFNTSNERSSNDQGDRGKDVEFLKQPSEPATAEDAQVAQDLIDTMQSMKDDCACLAANQIGVLKAVIVFDDNGTVTTMHNPEAEQAMRPYRASEGCLSLEKETTVTRFQSVKVTYERAGGRPARRPRAQARELGGRDRAARHRSLQGQAGVRTASRARKPNARTKARGQISGQNRWPEGRKVSEILPSRFVNRAGRAACAAYVLVRHWQSIRRAGASPAAPPPASPKERASASRSHCGGRASQSSWKAGRRAFR